MPGRKERRRIEEEITVSEEEEEEEEEEGIKEEEEKQLAKFLVRPFVVLFLSPFVPISPGNGSLKLDSASAP